LRNAADRRDTAEDPTGCGCTGLLQLIRRTRIVERISAGWRRNDALHEAPCAVDHNRAKEKSS